MRRERSRRLPSWVIGLVLLIVIAMGCYLAFTKELPWSDSYEIKAVFGSAQNIRPESPVRIAGVNVGKVVSVEHLEAPTTRRTPGRQRAGQQAAVVTMELNEDALPLHSDATFKLRPRLFLEGNYFVDVQPGSPNAPETPENHTFPVNQTSYSVQLDQVLTTLQGDVRADLQTFLDQLGNALVKDGGAEGFRELYKTSAPAGKYTSQVNQAVLGTQPGDLTGLIDGLDRVVRGLGRNEGALQSLVTNFRVFSGSFASEDVALGQAIEELPNTLQAAKPAFANLNAAFPPLRAFAREALPGVRSTPATLRAATPFINQVRALVVRARAPRPGRRPAADDPGAGAARAPHGPVPRSGPQPLLVLQRGRDPVGERHGRSGRPRQPVPAPAVRPRVRGDRVRAQRDRIGEPLRRRQRPVHPRRGRRRPEHGEDPGRDPEPHRGRAPGRGRPPAVPAPRRDAADRRLGEDPV